MTVESTLANRPRSLIICFTFMFFIVLDKGASPTPPWRGRGSLAQVLIVLNVVPPYQRTEVTGQALSPLLPAVLPLSAASLLSPPAVPAAAGSPNWLARLAVIPSKR